MLLRALILVALASGCWGAPELDPEFCLSVPAGYYCTHCMQPVYCDSQNQLFIYDQCTLGTVCELVDDAAVCVSMDKAGTCQCNSNFCDPYNPNYADRCNEDGIYDIIDCPGISPDFICNQGICELLTTTTQTTTTTEPPFSCNDPGAIVPGWNLVYPECENAYYCSVDNDNTVEKVCFPGNYVDQEGTCREAPPKPCAYSCEGYCPDELDCTRYYACDGAGGVDGGPYQCDPGFYFDPNNNPPFCSGTDDSVCAPVSKCDFSDIDW